MDEYYSAVDALPGWLAQPLKQVPIEAAVHIHEIRLRAGCAPCFTFDGIQIQADSVLKNQRIPSLSAGPEQMENILFTLCGGSIHSHEDELSAGFVTIPGGHRIGIGGRYVYDSHQKIVLQRVDSLNIRIARSVRCSIPPAMEAILRGPFRGLLIAGEPDSGKTTFLRSLLPVLHTAGRAAAIVDERCELFTGSVHGNGQFDVISGLEKHVGIQMALRTLGPQVILLDELGTMAETELLAQGFSSGVDFIATIHAASIAEAEAKPQTEYLLSKGMVRYIALLSGRKTPGVMKEGKAYC